jgi:outer membrane cobalamin receptor
VAGRSGLTLGWMAHRLVSDSAERDFAHALIAGAHHDFGSTLRVRASAGTRFRFPTLRQLYDSDGGNPVLDTEQATLLELGLERKLSDRGEIGLALFRTDVDDFIERGASNRFENFQAYRFRGVEFFGSAQVVPPLQLRASYTFLDTEDRSPGATRGALQYRPRHNLGVDARYHFAFGLNAYARVRHIGGQVYYSRVEPIAQRTLAAYTVADTHVRQRLLRDRLEAFLGATNVFDTTYEEEYGNPQAQRMLYGGLTIHW